MGKKEEGIIRSLDSKRLILPVDTESPFLRRIISILFFVDSAPQGNLDDLPSSSILRERPAKEFIFLNELPRNRMRKIMKEDVVKQFTKSNCDEG